MSASAELPVQSSAKPEQALIIPSALRHRARRRLWLFLSTAVLALTGIALAIVRPFKTEPVQYRSTLIERRTIQRTVDSTGHVDVEQRVEVPAPGPGRIVEILVLTGDRVTRGQGLARLDQRAATLAVGGARAGLNGAASRVSDAAATLSAAIDTRQRVERLFERELSSASDVKAAQAAEARARAALAGAGAEDAAAKLELKSAELTQSLATISAPRDGVVLKAPDAVGAAVATNQGPLFVIGSPLEKVRIYADVAESDMGEVRVGQTARFTVPAFANRSFEARVQHIGVDAQRTGLAVQYPVELQAENPEHLLLPGMSATVHIDVARAENVLATREAALRYRPDGASDASPRSRIFLIRGSQLKAVQVLAGISDGAYTALAAVPPNLISPGMRVALGVLGSDAQKPGGPGIKLGKR